MDRKWVTGVAIIYSYISLKREKINKLDQLDDCTIRVHFFLSRVYNIVINSWSYAINLFDYSYST